MAISYSTTVKNARLTAVGNAIDGGSGAGVLVIGTSALSGATGVLATIALDDPSFSVSGGVLTLVGLPNSATASASGTAAKAELRDSDDTVVATGLTVGTSGTDIIINTTAISDGQTVQVTSGTITHAA
jgi:hypothetical protein